VDLEAKRLEVMKRRQERELEQMLSFELARKSLQVPVLMADCAPMSLLWLYADSHCTTDVQCGMWYSGQSGGESEADGGTGRGAAAGEAGR
jgi:hypothetical protein